MPEPTPIKDVIKAFNYMTSKKSVTELEKLKVLRESIPNNIKMFHEKPLNISLEKAINDSKEFMESNFQLHPIMYIEQYEIFNRRGENFDIKITGNDALDPYNLPIKKTNSNRSTIESIYLGKENEPIKTYFLKINIQEKITEFTSSSVTHEITHTQQPLKEGNLKYYTNMEVLPILIEALHFFYTRPLDETSKRIVYKRLKYLVDDINNIEYLINVKKAHELYVPQSSCSDLIDEAIISTSTYIESTLKALYLSYLYDMSSVNIKKEILARIQEVFDANKSVEDFLNYYDATFENSHDYLQKKFKTKER